MPVTYPSLRTRRLFGLFLPESGASHDTARPNRIAAVLNCKEFAMTVDVFGARQGSRNFSFAAEVFGREPLYAGAALCLAAFIAPTLVAMTLDARTLAGVNVWLKPLRFEVALTRSE